MADLGCARSACGHRRRRDHPCRSPAQKVSPGFGAQPGAKAAVTTRLSPREGDVEERRGLQPVQPLGPSLCVGLSGCASDVFEAHHAVSRTGVKVLVLPPRRSISRPRAAKFERRLLQAVAPIAEPFVVCAARAGALAEPSSCDPSKVARCTSSSSPRSRGLMGAPAGSSSQAQNASPRWRRKNASSSATGSAALAMTG